MSCHVYNLASLVRVYGIHYTFYPVVRSRQSPGKSSNQYQKVGKVRGMQTTGNHTRRNNRSVTTTILIILSALVVVLAVAIQTEYIIHSPVLDLASRLPGSLRSWGIWASKTLSTGRQTQTQAQLAKGNSTASTMAKRTPVYFVSHGVRTQDLHMQSDTDVANPGSKHNVRDRPCGLPAIAADWP
jgi:hypothetical protein